MASMGTNKKDDNLLASRLVRDCDELLEFFNEIKSHLPAAALRKIKIEVEHEFGDIVDDDGLDAFLNGGSSVVGCGRVRVLVDLLELDQKVMNDAEMLNDLLTAVKIVENNYGVDQFDGVQIFTIGIKLSQTLSRQDKKFLIAKVKEFFRDEI